MKKSESKEINMKENKNVRELAKNPVTIKGEDVKIMLLNTADLVSSQPYQRDLDQKKIAQIVSNYDKHKFGIPKVSYRDGKYYVYDGQHRTVAIKTLNGNKDCFIQCEVHFGLTYEDEAAYFAQQYDGATRVDLMYQWRAWYEAKKEPVYTIVNTVSGIGIEVPFTKAKAKNRIIALKQLNDMWKKLGQKDTLYLLGLMKQFWNGDQNTYNKNIMEGMKEFYSTYKGDIDESIFVKQMKKTDPIRIEARGKTDLVSTGGLKFAKMIWDDYNHGLKGNRLDYKFKG